MELSLMHCGGHPAVGSDRLAQDVVSPDVETAGDAYATRFRGRLGAWFLDVQARETLRLLREAGGGSLPATALELGGEHAQLAGVLADRGVRLDVQGSRPCCGTRLAPVLQAHPDRVRFLVAPLSRLPLPDQSYDAVLAVRLMAHVEAWQLLLSEMARLARRTVLVDIAADDGLLRLARASFPLKHKVEGNTRPFFTHSIDAVTAELTALGFSRISLHRQFVWPMAAHRAIGRPWLSRTAEAGARALGLQHLTGGPVLICASRTTDMNRH